MLGHNLLFLLLFGTLIVNAQKMTLGIKIDALLYNQQRSSVSRREDNPEVKDYRFKLTNSVGLFAEYTFKKSRWSLQAGMARYSVSSDFDNRGIPNELSMRDNETLPKFKLYSDIREYSLGYTVRQSKTKPSFLYFSNGIAYSGMKIRNNSEEFRFNDSEPFFLYDLNKEVIYAHETFVLLPYQNGFEAYFGLGYQWQLSKNLSLLLESRFIYSFRFVNSTALGYVVETTDFEFITEEIYQVLLSGDMLSLGLKAGYRF